MAEDARKRNVRMAELIRQAGLRRVYLLPRSMVDKIAAYQIKCLLPSEAAAVRELLDLGLTKRGHPKL